jgi:carboxylesterase type B
MSVSIQHPNLGELKGNVTDGTAQFLGVKYATLQNRLATAVLVNTYGPGPTNTTNYGYASIDLMLYILIITRPPPVSPLGAINREFSFIQHTLPLPEVPAQSDIEGLNLNITVPTRKGGGIEYKAKLPVYVFVHGGGFAVGASWYPHYNPAAVVKLSTELGTPIIGVTIKYVALYPVKRYAERSQLSTWRCWFSDLQRIT